MIYRSLLALVIALVTSLTAAPLTAATYNVNSPSDVNDANAGDGICQTEPGSPPVPTCTLRAAIQEANALAVDDIVNLPALPPPGAYVLTLPAHLTISSNLTISGAGAATTIIDGNRALRPTYGVLRVNAGTVTIRGVAIRNGGTDALSSGGGGIVNFGTLTLTNSTVTGNNTPNQAAGIYNQGNLTVTNSTVSGNNTVGVGGGIMNGGTLTLVNSTVSGNSAGINGGGVYNFITSSTSTFINSTVSSNSAGFWGAGIFNVSGAASLFNVTIADNLGNLNEASPAGTAGAGVFIEGGTLSFQNTINLGNFDSAGFLGQFPSDCAGTVNSLGNNLVGSPTLTGCAVIGGGVTYLNFFSGPYLGALQNNGGPTRTHALLAINPAINGGNVLGCRDQFGALLTTDQRGFPRPSGTSCDVGAFELQDADSDGVPDTTDNCTLVANPTQLDANSDGYGNICDADLNNSGLVTTGDFAILRSVLNQSAGSSVTAAAADLNGSGTVTTADFAILRARLNTPPGPSGLTCAGTVPCP